MIFITFQFIKWLIGVQEYKLQLSLNKMSEYPPTHNGIRMKSKIDFCIQKIAELEQRIRQLELKNSPKQSTLYERLRQKNISERLRQKNILDKFST